MVKRQIKIQVSILFIKLYTNLSYLLFSSYKIFQIPQQIQIQSKFWLIQLILHYQVGGL